MNVSTLASQIMSALTSALVGENGILRVVPNGIKDAFEALFITTSGTGSEATSNVSTFAVVMLVFGGIALAFGITKLVFNLVANKIGAR